MSGSESGLSSAAARSLELTERMYLSAILGRRSKEERSYSDRIWSVICRTSRQIFGILVRWGSPSSSESESESALTLLIESWSDPTMGSYFLSVMDVAEDESDRCINHLDLLALAEKAAQSHENGLYQAFEVLVVPERVI
jgi:hypothetical protein